MNTLYEQAKKAWHVGFNTAVQDWEAERARKGRHHSKSLYKILSTLNAEAYYSSLECERERGSWGFVLTECYEVHTYIIHTYVLTFCIGLIPSLWVCIQTNGVSVSSSHHACLQPIVSWMCAVKVIVDWRRMPRNLISHCRYTGEDLRVFTLWSYCVK